MFSKKTHSDDENPRNTLKGSSQNTADMAPDARRREEDKYIQTPHSRPAERLGENEKPDQLAAREAQSEDRQEALLDEAVEETFPASDPVSAKHIT